MCFILRFAKFYLFRQRWFSRPFAKFSYHQSFSSYSILFWLIVLLIGIKFFYWQIFQACERSQQSNLPWSPFLIIHFYIGCQTSTFSHLACFYFMKGFAQVNVFTWTYTASILGCANRYPIIAILHLLSLISISVCSNASWNVYYSYNILYSG